MLPRRDGNSGFHQSQSGDQGCETVEQCVDLLRPLPWSGLVIFNDLHGVEPKEFPPMPPFPPPFPPHPPPIPSPPHGCPADYIRRCLDNCPQDPQRLKECDVDCIRECQHNSFAPYASDDQYSCTPRPVPSWCPFCSFETCRTASSQADLKSLVVDPSVQCIEVDPVVTLEWEIVIDRNPKSRCAQRGACPPLCISGKRGARAVLDRHGTVGGPLLTVTNGTTVTLVNLNLTGAVGSYRHDGGIGNLCTVCMYNTDIFNNQAGNTTSGGGGGGIGNNGTLLVVDSRIYNNTAVGTDTGGGIANGGNLFMKSSFVVDNIATASDGGGIGNSGNMHLSDTIIARNAAPQKSGGGIGSSGTVCMIGGLVHGNEAYLAGGGVGTGNNEDTSIVQQFHAINVSIFNNVAGPYGGGGIGNGVGLVYLDGVNVTDNRAQNSAGIGNGGGMIIAHDVKVLRNKAGTDGGGGGISSKGGLLHLINATISGNEGSAGGGISSQTDSGDTNLSVVVVIDSAIENNTAHADGGGVSFDRGGAAAFINVNITDNLAFAYGGGLSNSGGQLDLANVHFARNAARNGGGFAQPNHESATVMDSCTFEANHAHDPVNDCKQTDGKIVSSTACKGGAIFKYGNLSLVHVNMTSNTAQSGGGLHNDGITEREMTIVEGGLISNNSAQRGGGIFNTGWIMYLLGVEIADNHAPPGEGGSFYNIVNGGGNGKQGLTYVLPAPLGHCARTPLVLNHGPIVDTRRTGLVFTSVMASGTRWYRRHQRLRVQARRLRLHRALPRGVRPSLLRTNAELPAALHRRRLPLQVQARILCQLDRGAMAEQLRVRRALRTRCAGSAPSSIVRQT